MNSQVFPIMLYIYKSLSSSQIKSEKKRKNKYSRHPFLEVTESPQEVYSFEITTDSCHQWSQIDLCSFDKSFRFLFPSFRMQLSIW